MQTNDSPVSGAEWLVIVALEEERDEVKRRAVVSFERVGTADPSITVDATERDPDGRCHVVMFCLAGMGNEGALERTATLMKLLQPRTVLSIGISGALDPEVSVGDVVVASTTENWAHNSKFSVDNDGRLQLAMSGDTYRTSPTLLETCQRFRLHGASLDAWKRTSVRRLSDLGLTTGAGGAGREAPFVREGPVAAGPAVVAANELKRALRAHDRKFLAVDMESAGVARAVHEAPSKAELLIVRGISDAADETKAEFEQESRGRFRQWSMWNAVDLVNRVFWETPVLRGDIRGQLRALAEREYLPAAYETKNAVAQIPRNAVSSFFRAVTITESGDADPLDVAVKAIRDSPVALALRVYGAPGTGKSSFLALLYWRLVAEFDSESDPLIAYVNLQRYHIAEHDIRSASEAGGPRDALEAHLKIFEEIKRTHPTRPLIAIVDGFDPNGPGDPEIEAAVDSALEGIANRRVVGVKEASSDPSMKWGSPFASIGFRGVEPGSPSAIECATAFATMSRLGVDGPNLLDRAKEFRLKSLDAFTLYLLSTTKPDSQTESNLAGLVEEFVRNWVASAITSADAREHVIHRAARLAFQYEVEEESGDEREAGGVATENRIDQLAWALVRQHSQISNYLAARNVIAEFRRWGTYPGNRIKKGDMGYVYPYRINRFCKILLRRNAKTQREVLKGIRRVLEGATAHPYAKAHAAYLAGRVEGGQAVAKAVEILTNRLGDLPALDSEVPTDHDDKVDRLVWRTIYISLAYLGERDREEEYVQHLLSRPEWDRFNRGFHLEYYGDQRYTPSQPLVSNDELLPCPRTMEQLSGRLRSRESNPLRNVELQTLLSLAQHRHEQGELSDDDRETVISIAKSELSSGRAILEPLRNFTSMVLAHLQEPNFYPHGIFEEAYTIKGRPRVGWERRGLKHRESVAAHMYGAYLIGLFLLPTRGTTDEPYKKEHVLNMLLVHDLAESKFGDKLPSEKSESTKEEERHYFETLRYAGTYGALADTDGIYDLWCEFESGSTIDARVARDIDKLENLVQLRQYVAEGAAIDDAEDWEGGLLASLKTTVVKRMAEGMPSWP